jgi:hypothetical protein
VRVVPYHALTLSVKDLNRQGFSPAHAKKNLDTLKRLNYSSATLLFPCVTGAGYTGVVTLNLNLD